MSSPQQFDVVVVGAGPAGIAAAVRASESGANVALVDDNPEVGGQIWRASADAGSSESEEKWRESLRKSLLTKLCSTRIFDQPQPGILLGEGKDEVCELAYRKLILATGARERFLPFPGWTLPNVMGAGGLQALVKSGLPIEGKRVIVAGSGPLLIAVAAYLRKRGADLLAICEQAAWMQLAPFGLTLAGQREKLRQAFEFRKILSGVPFHTNSWPAAAHGGSTLTSVTISRNGKRETFACDYLACGFHLVPNIELHSLLGCQIKKGFVCVDEFQQTIVKGVFSAGEPNAIGGVDLALIEGQIAGLSATGKQIEARQLFPARRKAREFARALERAFRLRSELRKLASASTLVCRCEDVPHAKLEQQSSWREAKLHTRCGMGPCQGRICGSATQFLFGWGPDSVRPPIFPVRVASLIRDGETR